MLGSAESKRVTANQRRNYFRRIPTIIDQRYRQTDGQLALAIPR